MTTCVSTRYFDIDAHQQFCQPQFDTPSCFFIQHSLSSELFFHLSHFPFLCFLLSLSLSDNRERERRKDTQNVIFPIPSLVRLFFEKDKRFLHGRRQCQQHAIPLSSFPSLAASLVRPPAFVEKLVVAVLSLSLPIGRSLQIRTMCDE